MRSKVRQVARAARTARVAFRTFRMSWYRNGNNLKENKQSWAKRAITNFDTNINTDANVKLGVRFLDIAECGVKLRKQSFAPFTKSHQVSPSLTKTSGYWGINKVRNYQWASMG